MAVIANDEILDALLTIQQLCKYRMGICEGCPIFVKGHCRVRMDPPAVWSLNKPSSDWKAFEDHERGVK